MKERLRNQSPATPILRWRHGQTAEQVRALIHQKTRQAGQEEKLVWRGIDFSTTVGWGTVLTITGRVTDTEVIVTQCSGMLSQVAEEKIRETLEELFPGGEVEVDSTDDELTAVSRQHIANRVAKNK